MRVISLYSTVCTSRHAQPLPFVLGENRVLKGVAVVKLASGLGLILGLNAIGAATFRSIGLPFIPTPKSWAIATTTCPRSGVSNEPKGLSDRGEIPRGNYDTGRSAARVNLRSPFKSVVTGRNSGAEAWCVR